MQVDDLSPEAWASSSNEALFISLAEPEGAFTFKPTFTYPIFGDSEQIFGYKDLRIDLAFNCLSLYPLINVKYTSKLSDDVVDIKEKLLEFLPSETIYKDETKWLEMVEAENKDFKIPGEKVKEYYNDTDGSTYSIYKMNLKDPNAMKLHLRMQIFVLLFIEAGSYIDQDDKVWEIYTIYKNPEEGGEDLPSFVGFSTVYSYFMFQGSKIHDEHELSYIKYRKKISQFIILPPYQQKGHGKELYNCLFEEFLKDDKIVEVTVEDPSESFDDLRDRCDMERLLKNGVFDAAKGFDCASVKANADTWLKTTHLTQKMEKRQFNRCVEMGLIYFNQLKNTMSKEKFPIKTIRLLMKKRLYIKNKEALVELDEPTRRDKLQTAFQSLFDDYLRILQKVKYSASSDAKRLADDESTSSGTKRIKV